MKDAVRTFPPTALHITMGNHGELDMDAALSKVPQQVPSTLAEATTPRTTRTWPRCLAIQGNVTAESSG